METLTLKLIDIKPRSFLQRTFGSAKELDVVVEINKKIITIPMHDFIFGKSRDASMVLNDIFNEVERYIEKQESAQERAEYWLNKIKKMRGKISI